MCTADHQAFAKKTEEQTKSSVPDKLPLLASLSNITDDIDLNFVCHNMAYMEHLYKKVGRLLEFAKNEKKMEINNKLHRASNIEKMRTLYEKLHKAYPITVPVSSMPFDVEKVIMLEDTNIIYESGRVLISARDLGYATSKITYLLDNREVSV